MDSDQISANQQNRDENLRATGLLKSLLTSVGRSQASEMHERRMMRSNRIWKRPCRRIAATVVA